MSKIEAGGMQLDSEDVDLDRTLADCLRVVSGRAEAKKLRRSSSRSIEPDIHLRADRRAIKQIALNLLSNAVKFTPDGGTVTVRSRACVAA